MTVSHCRESFDESVKGHDLIKSLWAQHVADYGEGRDDKATQQKSLDQVHASLSHQPCCGASCPYKTSAKSKPVCRWAPIGVKKALWQA